MSQGSNQLRTTLISATANRKTASLVAVRAVDAAGVAVQVAVPGPGPVVDGRGPPKAVDCHGAETSGKGPNAARQGSEARRIRGSRVWSIPATKVGLRRSALQCSSGYT